MRIEIMKVAIVAALFGCDVEGEGDAQRDRSGEPDAIADEEADADVGAVVSAGGVLEGHPVERDRIPNAPTFPTPDDKTADPDPQASGTCSAFGPLSYDVTTCVWQRVSATTSPGIHVSCGGGDAVLAGSCYSANAAQSLEYSYAEEAAFDMVDDGEVATGWACGWDGNATVASPHYAAVLCCDIFQPTFC